MAHPDRDPWVPDEPCDTGHGEHFIRYWVVQDSDDLGFSGSPENPSTEILCPAELPDSSAISCRAREGEGCTLLFVADHGGRVFVYDVTEYLHTPPVDPQPQAYWEAPLSLTDEQPNNVRSIAIDKVAWTVGETTYEEVYVYASVFRLGVQVLRFGWNSSSCTDDALVPLKLIQTPSSSDWVHLRVDPATQTKTLILVDAPGTRAYTYPSGF